MFSKQGHFRRDFRVFRETRFQFSLVKRLFFVTFRQKPAFSKAKGGFSCKKNAILACFTGVFNRPGLNPDQNGLFSQKRACFSLVNPGKTLPRATFREK